MSDNKKYYYLKLKEDFFTSEHIILLESMKDGVMYSNILLKLYLMSLKNNGKLIFRDNIPYTTEMIATITHHQVGTVERAIKIFLQLGLIDKLPDNILYMADIELFIGKSSTEGERKRKARLKNKEKIEKLVDKNSNDGGQMSAICPPEIRDKRLDTRDKRLDIRDRDIDIGTQSEINQSINQDCALGKEIPTQLENNIKSEIKNNSEQAKIIEEWNSIDDNVPNVTLIRSESTRQKLLQARINEYGFDNVLKAIDNVKNSQYLKGYVKPFRVTFDWFIKPNNFPKILDGNYNDFTAPKSNDEEFDYIKANQYTEEEIKNFKTAKDLYPDIDDYIVNIEDLEI